MPIADTRESLEHLGYVYIGEFKCKTCDAWLQLFRTPKRKNMFMNTVAGTEDDIPQRLEFHNCPNAYDPKVPF